MSKRYYNLNTMMEDLMAKKTKKLPKKVYGVATKYGVDFNRSLRDLVAWNPKESKVGIYELKEVVRVKAEIVRE